MIAVLTFALLAALPLLEGGASIAGMFVCHTVVFLLAFAALADAQRKGHFGLAMGWESAAAFALLGLCALSFLRVDYRFGSFLGLWDGIMLALLWLTLVALGGGIGQRRVARAVVAGSSAIQAAAVLFLPGPANMTPSGSFANASQLAAYLDVGVLVTAGAVVEALRQKGRSGRGVAFAGSLVILLDTAALLYLGARGALIALLVASTIWLFSSMPPRHRRLRGALAAALVILAALSALAFLWRFERVGDPYRYDRVHIWRADLRAAADHPILGMGPGMFVQRGYRYEFPLDREMFRHSKTLRSTHSSWLQALVETGSAGFLALAILVLIALRRLWPHRDDGAVPALWACLMCGLVDDLMALPALAMTLVVLLAPRLGAASPADVPLRIASTLGRRAAVAAGLVLGIAWGRGVLIPYAAHVIYTRAVTMESNDAQDSSASRVRADLIGTAIALEPYNPLYRAQRGIAAWDRRAPVAPEAFASAHHDLTDALALDPGNTSWRFTLAQLHARACFDLVADEAQVGRTIALYRETIAMGRKDPRPHAELAAFLMAFGRPEEGIAAFREALAIEPRFVGARLSLVRALTESGRTEEAREAVAAFEMARSELAGHHPRNTYEADLMRVPGPDKGLDKSP